MLRATTELRTAAERLLALEASPRNGLAPGSSAVTRVGERFRQVLSAVLGAAGFRALLTRALTLAQAEAPELKAVEVAPDGSLDDLRLVGDAGRVRRFDDGAVVLVAHILGLLVTFIGEALMLRLVNDAWPKASFVDLDFDKGTPRD